MSDANANKTKKIREKPCPRGTRRNKKTGLCEGAVPPIVGPFATALGKAPVASPVGLAPPAAVPSTDVVGAVPPTKKVKEKPCPRGTRRNKKTGLCEPIKEKEPILIRDENQAPAAPTAPLGPVAAAAAAAALAPIDIETPLNIQNLNKNNQELLEREDLSKNSGDYDFLYPSLNDPLFNIKISERKEFNDTPYDGDIYPDIAAQAELLCNSDFELAPHQMFVRNFLSFQTPYNSLLLYHGLGSGKTCSAISVAEEMRDYIMQMGITSQIMIVASPNVQSNFKVQLFDERKLKLVDGLWNIRTCTGNKFLKEINPMNMKGLSRENVIKQINRTIDTYYFFFGYIEFANYISKKSSLEGSDATDPKVIHTLKKNKLRKIFSNRLIIIDEIHNIRVTDDNKDKRVADELMKLIKYVPTLRLLLLSATPMFNSYKEIIWLINLMNMNDRRATIEAKQVFNKDGSFKKSSEGEEIGKELLERKATGYVSFVRGENPYTFPYRIWPKEFSPENTFPTKSYPTLQLNGTTPLLQPIEHVSPYLVDIGEYQQRGYNYIIQRLKGGHIGNYKQMPSLENIETLGYTMLQQPLEALNIIYPDARLDGNKGLVGPLGGVVGAEPLAEPLAFNSLELVGAEGLKRNMTYKEDPSTHFRSGFDYNPKTLATYGRIFSPSEIGKYSGKIKTICDKIMASTGVILVYSQYIDGGLVPIVLALEELGFVRAGSGASLFQTPPKVAGKRPVNNKYVMITGDKGFSPNSPMDIKLATDDDNVNGSKVKVILISQTGAEGLDLKFVRQVHVIEPWYNMNRIEQIIGRAVRTCSHKALPFVMRNVEIYLYGSVMRDGVSEETADLYLYRLAEVKAIQIGKVSRILKEISIDCILNHSQLNFSEENMSAKNIKPFSLELGSGIKLENYKVGDKPFSSMCDYMEACSYVCRPNKEIDVKDVNMDTYNEDFIMMNTDKLIYKIKQLMKERFFYRKNELVVLLNVLKPYPLVQINAALHQLTEDKNEYVSDKYGRLGNLINIDDLYLFQPLELKNKRTSIYERSSPLDFNHDKIDVKLPKDLKINEAIINIKGIPAEVSAITVLYNALETKYKLASTVQKLEKGEKDWYMFCNLAVEFLKKGGIDEQRLLHLVVEHIVDELRLPDIIILLNQMNAPIEPPIQTNEVFDGGAGPTMSAGLTTSIRLYLTKQILVGKNSIKGFLWKDAGKLVVLVKQKNENVWRMAEAEDIKDLTEKINDRKTDFLTNLNKVIGFMNDFKAENYAVFKIKYIDSPRVLGARCDQNSNKSKAIEILNSIMGNNMYSTQLDIPQREICIIQELYLRIFENERKNKKHWFLSPPNAVLTNIEKFTTIVKLK
jgi:hypothetical protein